MVRRGLSAQPHGDHRTGAEPGDEAQLAWLKQNVAPEEIRAVVLSSRRLSKKTARCWQNYFGLREEEMRCFGMFSTNPDNLF